MMELTAAQKNHLARRASRKTEVLKCIQASHKSGVHLAVISKNVGVNRKYISDVLRELKAEQRIHVARRETAGGTQVAMYVYGKGFDADKSTSKPRPTNTAHAKKLKRLADEEQLAAIVRRKHDQWLKTWQPRPDQAAAWMTNAV